SAQEMGIIKPGPTPDVSPAGSHGELKGGCRQVPCPDARTKGRPGARGEGLGTIGPASGGVAVRKWNMPWARRGQRRYFYRSVRVGGWPVKGNRSRVEGDNRTAADRALETLPGCFGRCDGGRNECYRQGAHAIQNGVTAGSTSRTPRAA